MPEILVYLVFTMSIIVAGGAGYGSVFWSICVQRGPITDRSVSIDGVSGRNKFPRAAAQNMYHLSRKI